MDLLLRGRGASISARAPLWLVRACGGALGFAGLIIADMLGFSGISGLSFSLLSLCALLAGALLAPTRFGAWLWAALGALTMTSMLVALTPVVGAPARHFIRHDSTDAPVDAVVVLSGAMTESGLIKREVLSRLVSGVAEARQRRTGTVALSVIKGYSKGIELTSEGDQGALMALLAPDLTVRFVHDVWSTRDEALQFAALARTYRWQRVALVTSPLHTRRACRTFEVAGLPVVCVPASARDYSPARLNGAGARLDAFRDVVYETAASMMYAFRGWI